MSEEHKYLQIEGRVLVDIFVRLRLNTAQTNGNLRELVKLTNV